MTRTNVVHRRHQTASLSLPLSQTEPQPRRKMIVRRKLPMVRLWSLLFWIALVATSAACIVVVLLNDKTDDRKNNADIRMNLLGDTPDLPLIHIVNTRFMQEQANLTALSLARLHLFRTFSLPTMVHQSTSDFLWIIKTDPHLSSTIRQELVQLLQPYPHFYLVGTNVNFLVPDNHGAWRDGAEGKHLLNEAVIYTGNRTLLEQAQRLEDQAIVLETRLDADDGLHIRYLEYVQETALAMLAPNDATSPTVQNEPQQPPPVVNNLQWVYLCTRRHIEWHAADGDAPNATKPAPLDGWFNPMEHSKLCITPGITVGFAVGVKATDVPIYDHDKIYKEIAERGGCHKSSSTNVATDNAKRKLECLHWVDDVLVFAAIRSRTLTSAGMRHVAATEDNNATTQNAVHVLSPGLMQHMWRYVETYYFISRPDVEQTQGHLQAHVLEIAQDNLQGQCTSGHSCKQAAKEELQQLIQMKQQKLQAALQASSK